MEFSPFKLCYDCYYYYYYSSDLSLIQNQYSTKVPPLKPDQWKYDKNNNQSNLPESTLEKKKTKWQT